MAEVREVPMENIEIETRQEGEDEERVIVMYPAVFNRWSQDLGGFKERILPGAFAETIREDDIIAAFNHDSNMILGRKKPGTLELEEDSRGLRAVIRPPDNHIGGYVMDLIERGDIDGGSFKFRIGENGKERWNFKEGDELDEREIEKCRLIDVGPVTHPAYPDTEADLRDNEIRSAEEIHEKAREQTDHGESRGFSIEKRKLEIMELEN